jgi:CO dehydrogenase maturation factor
MPDFEFLGFMPYRDEIIEADLNGRPPYERDRESLEIVKAMLNKIRD